MRQHLAQPGYKKKLITTEVRTISVTVYELCIKNYLNLSYTKMNSHTKSMRSLTMLAGAIINFIMDGFKKIVNGNYSSFFATLTVPVSVSIIHSNFSPLVTFKKSLAKAGIVVVKEPATDCIFVSYFIFIPHIYWIPYINNYIYLFTYIYNFLYSIIYRNLYILPSLNYNYRSIPGAATPSILLKNHGS